jgi:hypothetical protein
MSIETYENVRFDLYRYDIVVLLGRDSARDAVRRLHEVQMDSIVLLMAVLRVQTISFSDVQLKIGNVKHNSGG